MSEKAVGDGKRILDLAHLLGRVPRVRRLGANYGSNGSDEIATEAATGIVDIQHSLTRLFEDVLPRLESLKPEGEEFEDVLDEIAEEYRHIHYHIVNTRLFNYVVPGA